MSIRPLAIFDLPYVYSFRDEAIGLDTARTLTRGNPLGAVGLIAYVNPVRHIYSAIINGSEDPVLGGIVHSRKESFAKLLYLAPTSQLNHPDLPLLIENLAIQAGEWGAFHVLAEVDERSEAFVPLRKAGFSVYAWQRMWDVSQITDASPAGMWRRVRPLDLHSVQNLYQQIVPPLLHPIEPQPKGVSGWMCNDGVKSYVSVSQGVYGIVLVPLIHPETRDAGAKLASLIANLPDRRNRPVYVCVRSYQAWLEPVLADLGAQGADRQAVMVKHLAHLVKEQQTVPAVPTGVSIQPSRVSKAVEKK
ncbi:MAG TPA: hypothetical protein VK909_02710 [Anaerolineales bacterium]|jgi:hypothetical protein|nr:hypothetical protein [Anaerolineales bacterium]